MGEREEEVRTIRTRIQRGGPQRGHDRQSRAGKLFVRDRLRLLFDDDAPWTEFGTFARNFEEELSADGVVTGSGVIGGAHVFFAASDFTVKAGSMGKYSGDKIVRTQEAAIRARRPILYLIDSSGGRIDEAGGHHADKNSGGQIFYYHSIMSGSVPQIGVLYGTCFAGTAYMPVFCDFLVMMHDASMAIASPRMVEMVIGQTITPDELGGAKMHAEVSGSAHFVASSEEDAASIVRSLITYLPASSEERPPRGESRAPSSDPAGIDDLIPTGPSTPYSIHKLIDCLVDGGSFLEVRAAWARELVVGLARIDGRVVGIVANNPAVKGGALFPDSSEKGAEFVWMCDAYSIPLLYLVDTPGFMVGAAVERSAILRKGRKFIFATSSATVPRICVVVRKSYGAGIYAMSGPAYAPDVTLALPSAEIAIMGPEAAINAVHFNRLAGITDADERARVVDELRAEYREGYDIFRLAGEMVVDELVVPAELRHEIAKYLELFADKAVSLPPRKHATIL